MRLARSSFMMGKVLFQSWILLDNDKEKHRMKMFMVREIE